LVILATTKRSNTAAASCQSASTAYRAALLSGLPITERQTTPSPLATTPLPTASRRGRHHLLPPGRPQVHQRHRLLHLIQTIMQGTDLKFDFFGTKTKTALSAAPNSSPAPPTPPKPLTPSSGATSSTSTAMLPKPTNQHLLQAFHRLPPSQSSTISAIPLNRGSSGGVAFAATPASSTTSVPHQPTAGVTSQTFPGAPGVNPLCPHPSAQVACDVNAKAQIEQQLMVDVDAESARHSVQTPQFCNPEWTWARYHCTAYQ